MNVILQRNAAPARGGVSVWLGGSLFMLWECFLVLGSLRFFVLLGLLLGSGNLGLGLALVQVFGLVLLVLLLLMHLGSGLLHLRGLVLKQENYWSKPLRSAITLVK